MAATVPVSKNWNLKLRNRAAEERLMSELGIPSLVAAVLAGRGMEYPAVADKFLNPKLSDLHDPALLPDYRAAVKEILGARERKELIFIHGDYDVDGVTSAALLSRFLKSIDCNVITHVPHRMREGYGIHASAIEGARAAGAKLFLTCDCGSAAFEQVEQARAAGMKVVVTDHHAIGKQLPPADAVVNPHRHDSEYPFEELSGVGVAFKLCEGITNEIGFKKEQYWRAFLDLAALGTIADVMPLQDENRIIARFGLQQLAETRKIGLRALMDVADVKPQRGESLRSYHVGYVLGPRLNAAGRIDDAAIALDLLLETDVNRAREVAAEIEKVNFERRQTQKQIMEEAIEHVLEKRAHEKNVIVIAKEGWHSGVIGIVAGRIAEQFRRPTFVLTIDSEAKICKGSGRSIPKFNLADAIHQNPQLFLTGGGHAMAAGCSFELDRLEEVAETLHEYAGGLLTEEDFVPTLEPDAELRPEEVTRSSVEALGMMEPFGCGNPEPLFCTRRVKLAQISPTKNPAHVRLMLRWDGGSAVAMGFSLGERFSEEEAGSEIDVVFQPCLETWRGTTSLKWHVRDYLAS